jgi:hypothetical protein
VKLILFLEFEKINTEKTLFVFKGEWNKNNGREKAVLILSE